MDIVTLSTTEHWCCLAITKLRKTIVVFFFGILELVLRWLQTKNIGAVQKLIQASGSVVKQT